MTCHEAIRDFLAQQRLAVLATQGSNGPAAALVAFAETEQLELIFQTFADSRKYRNLCENSVVAFVIGWDEAMHITIQYEGRAMEQTGEAAQACCQILKSKEGPCSDAFTFHPKSRIFKVTPTWIGYSNYTQSPPYVDEWRSAYALSHAR